MIKEYDENGETLYHVRVSKRSPSDPAIRIERSESKIKSLADAKRAEKRLTVDVLRAILERQERGTSWGQLVQDWATAVHFRDIFTKEITRGTLDEYLSVLAKYASHWEKKPVSEIDKAEAWVLLDQVEREVSRTRRIRLRTAIDAVFKWGILSGKIKGTNQLPTEGYRSNSKAEEKIPEILNLTEIRQLLKAAKIYEHTWYSVWALALFTGMRSGELYALEWDQVDFEGQILYVHRNWTSKTGIGPTKGRYWRTVPIESTEVLSLLKELKLSCGKSRFVLPRFPEWEKGGQAQVLRKFCEGIGLPSIKFHTLRSCFATQLIKDNIAPGVVMKICGWKDLKTMQRYIRLAGIEVKGATKGLKLLPPDKVMGRIVALVKK